MKQINLKLPDNLLEAAKSYVDNYGFKNIQDLATEAMREKIFEKNNYDESFSSEEIELIDNLIVTSLKKGDIGTEEELMKELLK
ncbi:MAG: hypothetical protein QF915_03860 [Candidatus Woesearchaeota archaeon]|jgi:hypothetical protein|nr:hypothetical protein [Candidatus Woesearchaeota archaeon]MDP7457783.1 hypothetical protein [Candidatus Woesearchaeota archaeon]|tara:strand:+ start:273 stop:524 length:252 start_codon:yes stop_codon:yes gene_type:complete